MPTAVAERLAVDRAHAVEERARAESPDEHDKHQRGHQRSGPTPTRSAAHTGAPCARGSRSRGARRALPRCAERPLEHRREQPREHDRQRQHEGERDDERRDALADAAGNDLLVDDRDDRRVRQVQAVGRQAEVADRPRVEQCAGAAPDVRWRGRPTGTRSPGPARGRPRTGGRASTPSPATRSSRARALRRRARATPTAMTCGPCSRRRCRR